MNKKLILGLGSLAAAALPVTAVVACGSEDKKEVKPEKGKDGGTTTTTGGGETTVKLTPDQKDVKAVAKLFDAYSKNGTATNLTNASTSLASSLTSATTAAALGFTDPSVSKLNGATVSFSVDNFKDKDSSNTKYSADDVYGTLRIEVKIKKNDAVEKIYFTLSGFKKDQDQIDVNEVAKLFAKSFVLKDKDGNDSAVKTTLANAKSTTPSNLTSATTAAALGFTDPSIGKNNNSTVSFSVKEANDGLGFVIVEALIVKNSKTQKVQFIIKGYKMDKLLHAVNSIEDFSSSDNDSSEAAVLPAGSTDVKDKFKNINGFVEPKLLEDISLEKVIVKTALTNKVVVYTVTFKDAKAKKNNTKTKDIKVTFA